MSARWWSFGVWALVAGSALFWGLRLFVKSPPAPAQAVVAELGGGARGDLTRLFGNDPPPPPVAAEEAEPQPVADARFQLIGVLSPRDAQAAGQGVALIAIDGKPGRAYRVGARVEGDTVLQSVRARGATLGPSGGAAQVSLEIAPPSPASTGTLPGAGTPSVTNFASPPPPPIAATRTAPPMPTMPTMPPSRASPAALPPGYTSHSTTPGMATSPTYQGPTTQPLAPGQLHPGMTTRPVPPGMSPSPGTLPQPNPQPNAPESSALR